MRLEIWQVDWNNTIRDERYEGRIPFDAYRCVFASDSLADEVCEDPYYHFNRGTGGFLDFLDAKVKGGYPMRSLSMGDIVVKGKKVLRCERIGWSDITDKWLGRKIKRPYQNGFCDTCIHQHQVAAKDGSRCRRAGTSSCEDIVYCTRYRRKELAITTGNRE